jgi:23S rRNA (uridine2552-2'-O)-methyltransferase
MARSSSSKQWLKEHFGDAYVRRSQEEGYRSRASYKLLEIHDKDQLIKPGMKVVDLGSAPGGWSQVAANIVGDSGSVIACDLLPMDSLAGVQFIQGDFTEDAVLKQILQAIGDDGADLVISDMAPNISGMKDIDQPRVMYLAELALDLARSVLAPGSYLLVKVFQGAGFDEFQREMRSSFKSVKVRKPKASRARSREVYLLGARFIPDLPA